nr:hypothetical protein MFLOJ_27440 [Mycobacterium florentinum]
MLMITNSAGWPLAIRVSLMTEAWAVASKLPLVPNRITCANRLLGGRYRATGRGVGERTGVESR